MKLNYKKTILVGFAFFLISAFWQAYDSIVPMMLVNKFGLSQSLSGIIMSIDNVIAVFLLPLFGSLSDRTNTKFGRRTPYIVVGTVIAVVTFFGLSFADNLQLAKIGAEGGESFYEQVFDGNYEIANAEYSTFNKTSAPEKYTVKDYASKVVKNKAYSDLTEDEQNEVKSWYKSINAQYLKDHTSPETVYACVDGVYKTVEVEDGKYYYYNGTEKVEIKKVDTRNAYTNLVTPAISKYAWEKTLSNPTPLVLFMLLLLVTLLSMAIFRSPAVALMPDVTVKPLRSQANAIINLMGTAGGMLVLVLGIVFGTGKAYNQHMSYTVFIGAVCLVMVIGLVAFILTVKEKSWAEEMREESVRLGIEENKNENQGQSEERKLSKPEFKSLILLLASVALWFIAYNAVTSKYSLYATNVLHMDYNTTLLLAQGAAIISYVPVGMVARKFGRKKCILSGITMLTVAFFGATFMTANSSVILVDVLFVLAGIGWATINVNSFPMVVELASGSNVGKYTGYYYTASMSAQILTPILSGLIMDLVGNMRPLFYYATVFAAIAFITMIFVKHGDSKPIAKKTVLESLDVED
ncbi:MAG: SLC45 family MFS transporter [Clostridiales bacterium]|nr:SLC45 family MFS transporter [Clostridiales bacterium]